MVGRMIGVEGFRKYLQDVRAPNTALVYADRAAPLLHDFLLVKGITLREGYRLLLQDFASWLKGAEFSPATVRSMCTGAYAYIEYCRDRGEQIPEIRKPVLPKPVRKAKDDISVLKTDLEIAQYLKGLVAARVHEPHLTLLRVLPYCGLRLDEIVKMQYPKDVLREVAPGGRERVRFHVLGKGNKERNVVLLHEGRVALRHYAPAIFGLVSSYGWRSVCRPNNQWMWPSSHHKITAINKRSVQDVLTRVQPFVPGLATLTPHTLRRTFGTLLARKGVDIYTIAEQMGHESVEVAARYYIVLGQDVLAQRVEEKLYAL